jgi:hypothetical protein
LKEFTGHKNYDAIAMVIFGLASKYRGPRELLEMASRLEYAKEGAPPPFTMEEILVSLTAEAPNEAWTRVKAHPRAFDPQRKAAARVLPHPPGSWTCSSAFAPDAATRKFPKTSP